MVGITGQTNGFYPDYRERTAGMVPDFSGGQAAEKTGLSGGDSESISSNDGSFLGLVKSALDIINPFQHIPVVGSVYRQATGDEINDAAKFAGDTLYGGILGGVISLLGIGYDKIPTADEESKTADITQAVSAYSTTSQISNSPEKSGQLLSIER